MEIAADLAARSSLCPVRSTPVHEIYDMTDCPSVNSVKTISSGVARQAHTLQAYDSVRGME